MHLAVDLSDVDWFSIAKSVLSLVAVVGLPLLAKKNARLASLLGVVIQGVEQADHPPTKKAIAAVAQAEGMHEHLDAVVQDQTAGAP